MTVQTPPPGPACDRLEQQHLPRVVAEALGCFSDSNLAGAVIAADTLPVVLADVVREDQWAFCPLTPDGFPLRFDFSSASAALTHTSAVCGPGTDPVQCLPRLAGLLDRLSAGASPNVMLALSGLQTGAALRFGALLRVTYDAATPGYTVYTEVPPDANARAGQPLLEVLGVQSLLPAAPVPGVAVLGYDVASGALEFVFGRRPHEPWELERICQIAGFGARFAELAEFIATTTGAPVSAGLPPARVAVKLDRDNMPVRFAVSFDAAALLGNDARCRRTLLRLAANLGWPVGGYLQLSARLPERPAGPMHHCHVAFSVTNDAGVGLSFGLRPPA